MNPPLATELPTEDDALRRLRASHAIERAQLRYRIGELERELAEGAADRAGDSEFPARGFEPATDFAEVWAGEDASHEERDAAQAFFQHGGPRCRTFFTRLSDDLLRSQRPDGSWRNRVGPGDEFSTAVACILLQMPRQYLPIFQR